MIAATATYALLIATRIGKLAIAAAPSNPQRSGKIHFANLAAESGDPAFARITTGLARNSQHHSLSSSLA